MRKSEFFRRAFEDRAYRLEKLADARYSKKVCLGFLSFSVFAGVVSALFAGLGKLNWETAAGWLPLAILAAGLYETLCTQVAALEAMEGGPKRSTGP
ncbi:MAG: hypothetical protein ABSA05_06265 [Opitutaceae bacterium]|jgi:hypothetical protein